VGGVFDDGVLPAHPSALIRPAAARPSLPAAVRPRPVRPACFAASGPFRRFRFVPAVRCSAPAHPPPFARPACRLRFGPLAGSGSARLPAPVRPVAGSGSARLPAPVRPACRLLFVPGASAFSPSSRPFRTAPACRGSSSRPLRWRTTDRIAPHPPTKRPTAARTSIGSSATQLREAGRFRRCDVWPRLRSRWRIIPRGGVVRVVVLPQEPVGPRGSVVSRSLRPPGWVVWLRWVPCRGDLKPGPHSHDPVPSRSSLGAPTPFPAQERNPSITEGGRHRRSCNYPVDDRCPHNRHQPGSRGFPQSGTCGQRPRPAWVICPKFCKAGDGVAPPNDALDGTGSCECGPGLGSPRRRAPRSSSRSGRGGRGGRSGRLRDRGCPMSRSWLPTAKDSPAYADSPVIGELWWAGGATEIPRSCADRRAGRPVHLVQARRVSERGEPEGDLMARVVLRSRCGQARQGVVRTAGRVLQSRHQDRVNAWREVAFPGPGCAILPP
jgi:hypothetical protein